MGEPKRHKAYLWKCQKCGAENRRVRSDPPRRCDRCLDKGVQTYVGREREDANAKVLGPRIRELRD